MGRRKIKNSPEGRMPSVINANFKNVYASCDLFFCLLPKYLPVIRE